MNPRVGIGYPGCPSHGVGELLARLYRVARRSSQEPREPRSHRLPAGIAQLAGEPEGMVEPFGGLIGATHQQRSLRPERLRPGPKRSPALGGDERETLVERRQSERKISPQHVDAAYQR
ncbi:MAG: hypothetical protein M3Q82_03765 [Actinomycetota bacterium]|nr:hypothetical protein [Actinomycetota bacterium]